MIVGTGVDIVEVARIQHVYSRFDDGFARKILTDIEFLEYKHSVHPVRFLARRFAAKEAAVKALGTGFSNGISFKMIQINHDELGRPVLELSMEARKIADQLSINALWVSISDEKSYATAMVIMEKN